MFTDNYTEQKLENLPRGQEEEVIKKKDQKLFINKGQVESDLKERMEMLTEKIEKQRLKNILTRLDDDYAINEKEKKLGSILKWQIESELKKKMERMEKMELLEMMTGLMREQKFQRRSPLRHSDIQKRLP